MAKRTGDKYEAILAAAAEVIAQFGYHKAQISRIARVAGVADGTIYLYFDNKDDILVSLFREMMARFLCRLDASLQMCDNAEDQMRALIGHHLGFMAEHPSYAAVTQIELRQPHPAVQREIGRVLKPYFERMDHVIRTGMADGQFSAETDVRLARKVMFGGLDQLVTTWVLHGGGYDLRSQVEPLWRFLSGGLKGNGVSDRIKRGWSL